MGQTKGPVNPFITLVSIRHILIHLVIVLTKWWLSMLGLAIVGTTQWHCESNPSAQDVCHDLPKPWLPAVRRCSILWYRGSAKFSLQQDGANGSSPQLKRMWAKWPLNDGHLCPYLTGSPCIACALNSPVSSASWPLLTNSQLLFFLFLRFRFIYSFLNPLNKKLRPTPLLSSPLQTCASFC